METLCKVIRPIQKSANNSTACPRLKASSQAGQRDKGGQSTHPSSATDPQVASGKLLTSVGPLSLSSKVE